MSFVSIIGLPRSGTTLLGRVLAAGNKTRYFEEPNPAWRYRNRQVLGHEEFTADDATPKVTAYIRRTLMADSGGPIVEKTPANCLRTGFVEAVLPEAKIIFLRRDAASVRASFLRKWLEWDDANAALLSDNAAMHDVKGQLGKLSFVHPSELPHYVIAGLRGRIARMLRRPPPFWGPEFKGWQKVAGRPPEDVAAIAVERLEAALDKGISGCKAAHVTLDYDAVRANPEGVIGGALRDLGVHDLTPDYSLVAPRTGGAV